MTSTGICAAVSFAVFAAVLAWEHAARIRGHRFKPSRGIRWLATKSAQLFRYLGRLLAWLSSFMTVLEELKHTLADLLRPTVDLLTSFAFVAYGYVEQAGRYRYPLLVFAGSVGGLLCTTAALHHFALLGAVRAFLAGLHWAFFAVPAAGVLAALFRVCWPWANILVDPTVQATAGPMPEAMRAPAAAPAGEEPHREE